MKSKFLARSRKMKSQVSFLKFEIERQNRKKRGFGNHLEAIFFIYFCFSPLFAVVFILRRNVRRCFGLMPDIDFSARKVFAGQGEITGPARDEPFIGEIGLFCGD